MRIQEIESTLAVVKYRSYAEAADATHQATSTVSKHVQRVEQELGVRLFERGVGRHDVELTDQGKIVVPYLKLMADDYQKMLDYTKDYAKQQARKLTIGYVPLLGTTGESEILSRFQIKNPEACVTHVLLENSELWQLLMQRKLDGAFFFCVGKKNRINTPWCGRLDSGLGSKQIYRNNRLYIGVGEKHRWAARESIMAEELEEETCLFNNISDHLTKDVSNLIFNMVNGQEPRIPFRVRYMSFAYSPAVYALIREGMGVLPQCCIPPRGVEGIRFLPVRDVTINARARFVYWKNAVPRIMNELLEEIDGYLQDKGRDV